MGNKQGGIAVNPASQITARQWAAMLTHSPFVPNYIRKKIGSKGNLITGPIKITQPTNEIPKDWPDGLAAVFDSALWEVTTAQCTFKLMKQGSSFKVSRRIQPDLQKGEFGPGNWINAFDSLGNPQKEWSPDNRSFFKTYELGSIALEFGETFSSDAVNKLAQPGDAAAIARLVDNRALIIIVNRVAIHGVKPTPLAAQFTPVLLSTFPWTRTIAIPETRLLSTFLHELSVHAGRMNLGRPSNHGVKEVEWGVKEIDELFPEDDTVEVVAKMLREVEAYMNEKEHEHRKGAVKGRSPGPLNGPAAGARQPGPKS